MKEEVAYIGNAAKIKTTWVEKSIYILTEPDGETVRYVGQSKNVYQRFVGHYASGRSEGGCWEFERKAVWIRSLRLRGEMPRMFVIDIVSPEQADTIEKKWIRHYNSDGRSTLNGQVSRAESQRYLEESGVLLYINLDPL